jgi:Ca-activated chloride channel family protein
MHRAPQPAAIVLLTVAALLGAVPAPADSGDTVTAAEIGHGSLLWRTDEPGRFRRAPNQSTRVEITVRGLIAETVVTQSFHNAEDDWVEGVYVFPLPAGAAVHEMRLEIGERVIEGRIHERAEAKRVYEQARVEGRKASLVEQERPNVFTTSVANVGPDEAVSVRIVYQEILRWDSGRFELRFPMVVGPRYTPGSPTGTTASGTGWALDTGAVPDASRITPPVLHPAQGHVNPVDLSVTLDAGLPLASVVCRSHPVEVGSRNGVHEIRLRGVPADRDFVLEWRPEAGHEPRAAVFTEELDGFFYSVVMLVPPAPSDGETARLARETVFVIDTSGSMGGASIGQARRALDLALSRLDPQDWFNVIAFQSSFRRLFPDSRQALPEHVDAARDWVAGLHAGGGTEMMPALRAALEDDRDRTPLRQVVFITDGCVGNEDALFAAIHNGLGRTRLFTVGIGSAPNSHFMSRAAAFGRGSSTHIGNPAEIEEKMGELLAKISQPVLADIELVWPDPGAEVWPARVPDLYAGEPVVVAARLGTIHGDLVVSGVRADAEWRASVPLEIGTARAGVNRLWARRKIADLMDRRTQGADEAEVRRQVVTVALDHHLVSRYTSLVAVDVTPSRPGTEGLSTRPVPTNLPAGWDFSAVFGPLPRGGTGARLHLATALLLAAFSWLVWRVGRAC